MLVVFITTAALACRANAGAKGRATIAIARSAASGIDAIAAALLPV